jgi:hypothetical protein
MTPHANDPPSDRYRRARIVQNLDRERASSDSPNSTSDRGVLDKSSVLHPAWPEPGARWCPRRVVPPPELLVKSNVVDPNEKRDLISRALGVQIPNPGSISRRAKREILDVSPRVGTFLGSFCNGVVAYCAFSEIIRIWPVNSAGLIAGDPSPGATWRKSCPRKHAEVGEILNFTWCRWAHATEPYFLIGIGWHGHSAELLPTAPFVALASNLLRGVAPQHSAALPRST